MELKLGPDMSYFLWAFSGGVALAFLYDFVRAARRIKKKSDFAVNAVDVIFALGAGICLAVQAYYINNGKFRIYSVLAMAGGFFLYRLVIGDRLRNIEEVVMKFILKFLSVIIKAFFVTIKCVLKLLGKPALAFSKKTEKNG